MEPPAIEFAGLTKRYGAVRALDGVDLVVQRGEVFGFLGPNGAGKTTALRVLMDLIRPTSGHVRVFGHDAQQEPVTVHRLCGYLPADAGLYSGMSADAYLRLVGALRDGVDEPYRDSLIERLRLERDRPIGTLSRGNRQKVGLVQALMARPPLVVLDEPTSGLDPLMQEVVEETLRAYARDGGTVFFSSHVLAEVEQVCDRVAMLRAGRVEDVFALEAERRLAEHVVIVEFAVAPPADAFAGLPGVTLQRADGAVYTFHVRMASMR